MADDFSSSSTLLTTSEDERGFMASSHGLQIGIATFYRLLSEYASGAAYLIFPILPKCRGEKYRLACGARRIV